MHLCPRKPDLILLFYLSPFNALKGKCIQFTIDGKHELSEEQRPAQLYG